MLVRAAVAGLVLALLSSLASAEKRVVLVIGNGAYSNVPKLSNPTRDAHAVEALFRAAGFQVVEPRSDLGTTTMRRALRDFSEHVRDADIAVVFYAGHGIEVNGTNYLVPVDALLERDIDVDDEAVSLDRVIQLLEQAKRLRLIILDACRDNPFARSIKRTTSNRSIGRGLAKVDIVAADTLVAFAAKAGSTAADGDGPNSPYTAALLKHLTTPGLDLRLALGKVRDEVLQSTRNKQEPFVYGSLGGSEIALVPVTKPQPRAAADTCPLARVYEYPSGRFVKDGKVWVEYHQEKIYARFEEFSVDREHVYIIDKARRREHRPGEVQDFYVRIPVCGGISEWSYSNPLIWKRLHLLRREE